eukprot:12919689-Prorocentrum_lima.AAC.1
MDKLVNSNIHKQTSGKCAGVIASGTSCAPKTSLSPMMPHVPCCSQSLSSVSSSSNVVISPRHFSFGSSP